MGKSGHNVVGSGEQFKHHLLAALSPLETLWLVLRLARLPRAALISEQIEG